jgi:predicted DNA-binding transcriptional regulator YafY
MEKIERLFFILNLLRSRGTLTTNDLADECEVSESTIYRDIQSLSEAHIPICCDNGYKVLGDESFLPPINFTVDEFLTLHVGLSSHPVQAIEYFRKSAKQAQAKIESLVPQDIRADYEKAKGHVVFQPEKRCSHRGASLIFELLKQAIWPERKIKLKYVSPLFSEEVEVVPKSLLFKRGDWYLEGMDHHRIRYFRLEMIKDVSLS